MTMNAPQSEAQVEIDPYLFGNLCSKFPSGIIVRLVEKVI